MKNILSISILSLVFIQCTTKQEISQWRGPNRDGIYPDTNLLKEWPTDGPTLIWKVDSLGIGYSSPVFTDEEIIITGMRDSVGYLYALDLNGKILWQKAYGAEWTGSWPGTRCTPLIYNGKGYLLTSFGEVYCFDIENGEKIWSKKVYNPVDNNYNQWGLMENLIADGKTLFCTPGDSINNILALNSDTGEITWTSQGMHGINTCSTPIIITLMGKKFYITLTDRTINSIDVENGKLVWSHPISNKNRIHANTPIFRDGKLFIMMGFEMGSLMLQLSDDGSGVKELWNNPTLDETNGHAVLIGENLYLSAESKGEFRCVDWNTGETKYFIKKYAPGTVISADGLLYCYSYDGDFGLLQPADTMFIERGYFKLPKTKVLHITHPVIHKGILYIRHDGTLRAYYITK